MKEKISKDLYVAFQDSNANIISENILPLLMWGSKRPDCLPIKLVEHNKIMLVWETDYEHFFFILLFTDVRKTKVLLTGHKPMVKNKYNFSINRIGKTLKVKNRKKLKKINFFWTFLRKQMRKFTFSSKFLRILYFIHLN